MFPIMAAVQAAAGVLCAKKKQQEAQRTNAARAALGEAPNAEPGEGPMGALSKGLGGIQDAMKNQPAAKPAAKPAPGGPPVPGPNMPMYGANDAYPEPMPGGPSPMGAGASPMPQMGPGGANAMDDDLLNYGQ
jgi:hypothetical protein